MAIVGTILLVIVKIILIILCVIAGLLCLILFVPVRYHLEGRKEGSHLKGRAEVTFLFRAVVFRFLAEKAQDKELSKSTHFYLFGIDPMEQKKKRREKKKEKRHRRKKDYLDQLRKDNPEKYEELKKEAQLRKEARATQKPADEEMDSPRKTVDASDGREKSGESARQNTTAGEEEGRKKKKRWDFTVIPYKIIGGIGRFFSKLCQFSNGFSYWFSFLTSPLFLNALHHVSGSVIRLLKALLPKKVSGNVQMGFDDPSVTGKALAFSCAFLHAYGPDFYVIPDFDGKKLEGNAACDGKIRLILPARLIVSLLLDRNVREAYHIFKNRKEEA